MTTNVVSDEQLGVLGRRYHDLFRRLREGTLPIDKVLAGMQDIIEGNFDAIPHGVRRLIDCDAAPWCPDDWNVESHQKGGQFEFDAAKVSLHLDDGQKDGRIIVGSDLRKRLEGKPVLNACVLDHLLANTNLIPESWKADERGPTRRIYFWGTIYSDSSGDLYVRCLRWCSGGLCWRCRWLGRRWDGWCPAAVSAS